MNNEGNDNEKQNNSQTAEVMKQNEDLKPMKGGNASLVVYLQLAYALFFGTMFYVYTSDEYYYGSELECVKLLPAAKEIFNYYVMLTLVLCGIVFYSLFCSKKSTVVDTFFDTFISFVFLFFFIMRFVLLIQTTFAYAWGEKCGSLNNLVLIWMIIIWATTVLFVYFLCCCCLCLGLSA
jgi:hypothetical protein